MPVQLPTTFGATDYNVTLALNMLAAASNTLEATHARMASGADMATVRAELADLRKRIDTLTQQVTSLMNP